MSQLDCRVVSLLAVTGFGFIGVHQRLSAVKEKFLSRNRFVADAFWFSAFGAELATVFCGLVSADMPVTGTEGFASNSAYG